MDNIDCLKKLTEDIVKKQKDSLESVKRMSQATDIISSDILNLINSLQMVGNRQFAENKIRDDDLLTTTNSCGGVSSVHTNTSSTSPESDKTTHNAISRVVLGGSHHHHKREQRSSGLADNNDDNGELKLCSILLRAIELLPPVDDDVTPIEMNEDEEDEQSQQDDEEPNEYNEEKTEHQQKHQEDQERPQSEHEVTPTAKTPNFLDEIVAKAAAMTAPAKNDKQISKHVHEKPLYSDKTTIESAVQSRRDEVSLLDNESTGISGQPVLEEVLIASSLRPSPGATGNKLAIVAESTKGKVGNIKAVDPSRVADILKRYSLYDDNEDEEEEEEDSD